MTEPSRSERYLKALEIAERHGNRFMAAKIRADRLPPPDQQMEPHHHTGEQLMNHNAFTVQRKERGWAGHFICANRCRFRRNTLLECGDTRIVVSTVGLLENIKKDGFETVGDNRYFETMAFHAAFDGRYWDADVSREISFESPWCISEIDADDRANDQHEAVVWEICAKLHSGCIPTTETP